MDTLWKSARKFSTDRWGNIAILTAVSLPILAGFVGLGVETGYWYFENRRLQASADLAAYAGAVVARSQQDGTAIISSAETEAQQHGFDPAAGTIQVNWPPTSGAHTNSRSVEVILQQQYPRYFSAVFTSEPVIMNARAVATYEEANSACVIALDETHRAALSISGYTTVNSRSCSLMSNSLADDAVYIGGSANVTTSCILSAGGVDISATLTLEGCPEPRLYVPRADDPYADIPPPPDPGFCSSAPSGSGSIVLSPGKYCGGLNLNGDVTIQPGMYIVSGGTMLINDNTNIYGDGVTFYLTNRARLLMNGTADIHLSAPTSGTYAGILFFGDRRSRDVSAVFNGTADSSLIGSLYFPSQQVTMRGDFAASGGCTRIVADTIQINGNPNFDGDCTAAGVDNFGAPGAVLLVE